MPTQSKHASINISLIQAREALMTQFRPILNQANITDQQWRIIRLLAENGTLDFQDLANQACILRPSLTGILTRLEKSGFGCPPETFQRPTTCFSEADCRGREAV